MDRTFTDKVSGRSVDRPGLTELLGFVRDGDTVVVHSLDRLARNVDDLRRLVRELTGRGVRVEFIKEHLTFTGEDSPMATLLLSIMGSFAEFERALLKERQLEGITLAKRRGVFKGRKPALTADQVLAIRERIAVGAPKARLARQYGVSRDTLYQHLRNPGWPRRPPSSRQGDLMLTAPQSVAAAAASRPAQRLAGAAGR